MARFFLFFFIAGIVIFSSRNVQALDVSAYANSVARIETYINGITHMQGDFIQKGPGDFTAQGQFWLRRPWRVRFSYAPPSTSLIIADGVWLAIQTAPRKPAERYPLGATPARFILAPNLRIQQEANILNVAQKSGRIHLWLSSRDDNLPGRVQLRFRQNPLALEGWTIIDAQGMTTKMSLKNVKRGIRANNRLFFVEETEPFKKRR